MPDPVPEVFKGIALFTPAGDLLYSIDTNKQNRWHLQLCLTLQDQLGLAEPPHFLVPHYTATIDRWRDPQTQRLMIAAEAGSPVWHQQTLLNAAFGTPGQLWQQVDREAPIDPLLLAQYRQQFPQLWQPQDWVVRLPNALNLLSQPVQDLSNVAKLTQHYVLRLFVSNNNVVTGQILQELHRSLEQHLHQPYTLKLVDVRKHPEQAEANQISATPTLVRVWPLPVRRIVGDFSNISKVLEVLAVPEA